MQKKKKLLKRRKKKAVHRRKHYLDEAPLQPGNSAVFVVKRTEKNYGVDSEGWGQINIFVLNSDAKLSEAIYNVHRTLGEGAKFTIEQIISGIFVARPGRLQGYCNSDGRIFNEKMEVVGKAQR